MILANVLGGNERFIPFVIGVPILAGAFWLACYVPGRTEESHKNLEKITGFKKFLETAEKDRLEMLVHDNPKYFYNILPFAYVLGVSDKWVDKFEGIAIEPPEWYSGHGALYGCYHVACHGSDTEQCGQCHVFRSETELVRRRIRRWWRCFWRRVRWRRRRKLVKSMHLHLQTCCMKKGECVWSCG